MMQVCRKVTGYGFGGLTDQAGVPLLGEAAAGRKGTGGTTSTSTSTSKRPPPYHYWKGTGARSAGNEESHSFNTEAHLIQEMLNPNRKHPAAGHPWFNPDTPALKNLRICRSVANPNSAGHQRCARGEKGGGSGEKNGGSGGGGGGGRSTGGGEGGVTKLKMMPS